MTKGNKTTTSSTIQDLKAHQKYQYFPGYYTGGKISPFFKSRSKLTAVVLLLIGIALAGWSIFSWIFSSDLHVDTPIIYSLIYLIMGVLFIAGGLRVFKLSQDKKF